MNTKPVHAMPIVKRAIVKGVIVTGAALTALLCAACAPVPPRAVPVAVAAPPPQSCREFNTSVMVGGAPQRAYGTACLQPDGSWRIQQMVTGPTTVVVPEPQTYVVAPRVYRPYYPPAYVANPWVYGPPLFVGGVYVGGGWGHHGGWHGGYYGHHRY